jgi:hypothetical protein
MVTVLTILTMLTMPRRSKQTNFGITLLTLQERISTELLPRVQQPSQTVGLEHNARRKPWGPAKGRAVLAFPDACLLGI